MEAKYKSRDGKRYTDQRFDIMLDNGTKFFRTVKLEIPLHFEFSIGMWCSDYFMEDLVDIVRKKYPASLGNKKFRLLPS